MSRARLEAFSDGVFAVAITLLALNLTVPGPGHGPLLQHLTERWPAFVAYLISFFTVGIIWVNHHTLMNNIAGVDRVLLFINLVLLLFVVAIPFGTSTAAAYLLAPQPDARVAMILYDLILLGMGLGFAAIFFWSMGEGRMLRPFPVQARRAATVEFLVGTLGYLLALVVAFFSAPAALAINGLVAGYYIFERSSGSRAS